MPAALRSIFGAGITVLACLFAGSLLARACHIRPSLALTLMLGSASLSPVIFLLSLTGVVHPWTFAALALVLGIAAWRYGGPRPALILTAPWWVLATAAIYGAIYFIYALAPEASPDGSGYHLGLVRLYLEHGRMFPDPSMYASFPEGMEMLYLMAYSLAWLVGASAGTAGSAAALVHLTFLAALISLVFDAGRRAGAPLAGYAAGLVVLASPVIGISASTAYVDVALAALVFGSFIAAREGAWAAAGLLAGFAFGIKYTAFTMIAWVLLYAIWKSRRVRAVALTAACAALTASPWLIRNWVWRNDPVAPFLNRVFPNPNQYVSVEEEYRHNMAHFGGANIDSSWPAEVTYRGAKLQSVTGVAFLASPVALLSIGQPGGAAALSAAAFLFATYPANLLTRFLIPALPFIAFSTALVLARWRWGGFPWLLALWTAAQVIMGLPWAPARPTYRIREIPWKAALRLDPEEVYLRRQLGDAYEVARLIEARVPPDGVVYTALPVPDAYAGHEIILNYTFALGNRLYEVLYAVVKPTPQVRLRLHSSGRAIVRCRDCGSMGRVYEAPEGARVFSNRWDAPLLFDQNPATFWSPWGAGSTEIETGAGELLLSPGDWASDGGTLAQEPSELKLEPRDAIAYFRRAGVTHLVIYDLEAASPAIRRDPQAWNLEPIGGAGPVTLYRVRTP